MTSFEGFIGWLPFLFGMQAVLLLIIGVLFFAYKKQAQAKLAQWARDDGASTVTDPGISPARAMIAGALVDHGSWSAGCEPDTSDSGCDSGGSDGGGGGGD